MNTDMISIIALNTLAGLGTSFSLISCIVSGGMDRLLPTVFGDSPSQSIQK
jgi:hypothetical protein